MCDPQALLTPVPPEGSAAHAGVQGSGAFPTLIGALLDESGSAPAATEASTTEILPAKRLKQEPEEEVSSGDSSEPVLVFWQPPIAAPLMIFAPLDLSSKASPADEIKIGPSEPGPEVAALVPDARPSIPEPALPRKDVSAAPTAPAKVPVSVEVDNACTPPAATAALEMTLRPKPGVAIQAQQEPAREERLPASAPQSKPPAERSLQAGPILRVSPETSDHSSREREQPPFERRAAQTISPRTDETPADRADAAEPPRTQTPTPPQAESIHTAAPAPAVRPTPSVLEVPLPAAKSPQPETVRPREVEASREPERVDAPRPLTQLSLRVSPPGRPSVHLRFVDKPEGIHVRLLTSDESIAAPIRRELPQLIRELDRQGLTAESSVSHTPAPAEERRERQSLPASLGEMPARDASDGSSRDGRRHSDGSPEEAAETHRRSPRNAPPQTGFYSIVSAVSAALSVQKGDSRP